MSRKKWSSLDKPPLSDGVLAVITNDFGFDLMTPVQTAAIPLLLSRKDVCAQAVTGSGKTLAFLVPLLEMLQRRHQDSPWQPNEIGALVISPTRELAFQTAEVLEVFLKHAQLKHLKHKLIVGGNSIEDDIRDLKKEGASILICTPGRLEDLFQRKGDLNLAAKVKPLEFLVLDEADRLLDFGFKNTINTILAYLPRQRRTGLFSATQTNEVTDLIRAGMRNPVLVSVKEKSSISTPINLRNYYCVVEPEHKLIALLSFVRSEVAADGKLMIFFPTCACVEYWLEVLPQLLKKRKILGLHGKMKSKRQNIIDEFRNEQAAILLCTDVLARGLDVPEIDWVIQWDPPSNASSFVHRVGRTARQGNEGNALVFLLPSEDAYVTFLKINQKVDVEEWQWNEKNEYKTNDLMPTLRKLHKMQFTDKTIYDKGIRAFVSHIRAYTKHECNAILRLRDVDLGKAATAYGLLQMPRMPELKNADTSNFIGPTNEVDISKLKYKNAQKEQAHQNKLKTYEETGEWPGKKKFQKKSESWEQTKKAKLDTKTKKEQRKAKKQRKKEAEAANGGVQNKKRKQKFTQEDLDELASDIRMFKKLKKNKITEEEFDKAMGLADDDGNDASD